MKPVSMLPSLLLPLFAFAARGAPTGDNVGGACRVVWAPASVDTSVEAPSATSLGSTTTTDGWTGVYSGANEGDVPFIAQPGGSTKPETKKAAPLASTTMERPAVVTSASIRTASSNKLSPTGTSITSTTTITTTVTTTPSKSPIYTPGSNQKHGVAATGRKNVVYFTNWSVYGANYTPAEVPAGAITHLLYAFGDISNSGEVISSDPYADTEKKLGGIKKRDTEAQGNIDQIYTMKQKNRNMKVLLSIGGFSYSQAGKFGPASSTVDGRRRFAHSAVKLMANWGFDGIDVDWEYPKDNREAADFVTLLKDTRYELNRYAKDNKQDYRYLLTVAASAGPSYYKLLKLKDMDEFVDSWNLMAYDYAGAWDKTTGHQANVFPDPSNTASTKFNTEQAVDDYIAAGIAPDKLNLGFPLYGRSFTQTDGMGKEFTGVGKGSIEPGVWLYKDLPRPGANVTVDKTVLGTYSYDTKTRELVSYDNAESASLKALYLMRKGLGGAVFWDASGDRPGKDSLVASVARSIWPLEASQNMLEFPASEYSNIRGTS